MANIKPADLRTGKTGKDEIEDRKKAEEKLKGKKKIPRKPKGELNESGIKLYQEIIKLLPDDFLSGGDTYVVSIVADALSRMDECRKILNCNGMFNESGIEMDAVKTYERYSKIFDKFSSKLGLSPKDRAALAVLKINSEDEKTDPVLQALRE
ncbi:P27 family phage terminase small subunit [Anaerotignum sp. MB30-C6]|uniref:P27 family phage terminase small subunit n=1 Tax=Anaerotignum sp. MB30-C6 TaxID=3070814 RepID=UPI0027DE19E2|nr:P27 family phage terminase small subunit [Anaerotignum sp. MB30-C6]WMI80914.1 P27 family phage terminase small subunit [Anaerotignum sp. MB30-C6]